MQNNHILKLKSDDGFPFWHIVNISKIKEPLAKKSSDGSEVNVTNFGEILASGWGEKVPEEIIAKYNA